MPTDKRLSGGEEGGWTPTPWRASDADGDWEILAGVPGERSFEIVAEGLSVEDATIIERAVNAFEAMRGALKAALPHVARIAASAPTEMERQKRQREACTAADMIRAALKLAEEG